MRLALTLCILCVSFVHLSAFPAAVRHVEVEAFSVTGDPGHTMDHTMDHTHDPDDPDHGGMMKMWFHHTSHATILFEGWHTMTYWELFLSCLAVMVMAALYEGYKSMREWHIKKYSPTPITSPGHSKNTVGSSEFIVGESGGQEERLPYCDSVHIVQGLLHMGQVWINYCLMLIFMTYNIWLCLFVTFGAGLGYFLFGRNRSRVDVNEHCH